MQSLHVWQKIKSTFYTSTSQQIFNSKSEAIFTKRNCSDLMTAQTESLKFLIFTNIASFNPLF